jgi:glycerophosphoryl diester phosphodiesterase
LLAAGSLSTQECEAAAVKSAQSVDSFAMKMIGFSRINAATSWSPIFLLLAQIIAMSATSLATAPTTSTVEVCHKNSLIVPVEAQNQRRSRTLTIAHRGASYHLPEHSLEAYRLALELGADFIEPDLVVSSDGVLFAMHSVDLSETTDVAEKFSATRTPWFSPTANRTGYWSFNFTWAEIQTLRLRQRLPLARTTMYDGILSIPSLDQILDLLYHWNTIDLPSIVGMSLDLAETQRSPLLKYQSGLYIEFKSLDWIQAESGWDLVDLLYNHIALAFDIENAFDSAEVSSIWKHLLPCFETTRFDEYIVPGLVLQSFNGLDLQRFHEKWHAIGDSGSAMISRAVEPPYVLLVDRPKCWEDTFWYAVGEKWRPFLSGIGCDKNCLLEQSNGTTSGSEEEKRLRVGVSEKASEFGLVLHPWTERPESQYFSTSQFASALDETHYLLCKVPGVHGIFSESVDLAVRAAFLPCDEESGRTQKPASPTTSSVSSSSSNGICYESHTQANLYVGSASFVLGTFAAVLLSCCWSYRKSRRLQRETYQVSMDEEPNDDGELNFS